MSGYCDLHLHLLPGVDDGAKTLDDTLEMARALVDLGYVQCAPSPHAKQEYAPREVVAAKLEEVREALARENIPLEVHGGAENDFLEPALWNGLERNDVRRIATGPYVLIEAPYTSPLPQLPELIFRLKLKGIVPVIAHPERCFEFERRGRAAEAVRSGALLQLDMGALNGRYGTTAKKLSLSFLQEGLYAVAATDLHSPLKARDWVGKAIKTLVSEAGELTARELLSERPRKILRGDAVEEVWRT